MVFSMLRGLASRDVENISQKELEAGDYLVVDIRYKKDYQAGHIPGALNLPYPDLEESLEDVLADVSKDKELAVVCVKGIASRSAVLKLMEAGYKNAKSLKGGIKAWQGELESN